MARVIGIGETVFNIVMCDGKPVDGMPSGDIFNTMISLGRCHVDASFISEVGDDRLGSQIIDFMLHNGVKTEYMYQYHEGRTPLSLAHLDAEGRAQYDYYILYPQTGRLDVVWPRIDNDDFVYLGSQYVLQQEVRTIVVDLLTYAQERKAMIMYNPNLHHLEPGQAVWLMPSIIENLEFSDIVCMSTMDMQLMYKETDTDRIYHDHVQFYCPTFIAMHDDRGIGLRTRKVTKDYPAPIFETCKNMLGVDDAFSAGVLYELDCMKITKEQLPELSEDIWDKIIMKAFDFAQCVAASDEAFVAVSR